MRKMSRTVGLAVVGIGLLMASARPARAGGAAGQLGSVLKHAQQVHDLQITDEEEQKLGTAVSENIRKRYGVVQDPTVHSSAPSSRRPAAVPTCRGSSSSSTPTA